MNTTSSRPDNAPIATSRTADDREARIQAIGRDLIEALSAERPLHSASSLLSGRAVQRRLLAKAVDDPQFRTQLFRFIDVYPSLRDSGDLERHLRAYLDDRGEPPPPLDRLLGSSSAHRLPSWAVARLTDRAMQRMAKGLIAGQNPAEAMPTLRRLRKQRTGFSLDLLTERVLSHEEAADYLRRFEEVLDGLAPRLATWPNDPALDWSPLGEVPRLNVSLKLSCVHPHIDPADFEGTRRVLFERLRPLFIKSKQVGAFICLDMEQRRYHDLTYAVFADLVMDPELRDYPHLGVALQAYLRESEDYLRLLVSLARQRGVPITIRLVKGAYWEHETITALQEHWPVPVFSDKIETDTQFEKLADMMVEKRDWIHPVFATHNIRSIAAALAAAEAAGLSAEAVELQFLHGLADPIRRAATTHGYRVREYVPVGAKIPGIAYLVQRLVESTTQQSSLRKLFAQEHDETQLLAPPVDRAASSTPTTAPDLALRGSGVEGRDEGSSHTEPTRFASEPKADFSDPAAREEMRRALTTIRGSFGREYPLIIGGESIATPVTTLSRNPAHPLETIGIVAQATNEHADLALAAARDAFPSWRNTPARERTAILFKAAALMREQRYQLAALVVLEAGKPWKEADADVTEAIDFLEYYAREMHRLHRAKDLSDVPGEENLYFYEPRGIAVVIAPWNFPLAIPAGMISAALVAGNTVVFKPADPTPVAGYALVQILLEAGLPQGALSFLPGPGSQVGEYLVSDPRVDLIAFTGSLDVGRQIIQKAAVVAPCQRSIKKVITELGGKNAIIVDTDANLDDAVEGVLVSAFGYSGQKCSACSRVIVMEEIYDQFIRRLTQAAASLPIGDPANPATRVGPVITDGARVRIFDYIAKGRAEATLVHPPGQETPAAQAAPVQAGQTSPGASAAPLEIRLERSMLEAENVPTAATAAEIDAAANAIATAEGDGSGYFVRPHIFIDVPTNSTIAQEEIFGPVLAVSKAAKFSEALESALAVRYGLTGGLYSRNPAHIRQACREFRVGNLYVNRPTTGAMVGRQPFGGSRMSGMGSKVGGPDYLLQFMESRTVTENTLRRSFAPAPDQ